jgi:hypothetical protein
LPLNKLFLASGKSNSCSRNLFAVTM